MVTVWESVVDLLLTEQRRVDPARYREPDRDLPEVSGDLLAASAAIAGGAARLAGQHLQHLQARTDLTPDQAGLARALRVAAMTLDVNWFPGDVGAVVGGAGRDGGTSPETDPLAALNPQSDTADLGEVSSPTDPAVLLAVEVAGWIFWLRSLRSVIGDAMTTNGPASPFVADALSQWQARGDSLTALSGAPGWTRAHAYWSASYADLLHRADLDVDAETVLAAVENASGSDRAVLGHAAILRGDWAANPDASPECGGHYISFARPSTQRPPDPVAAARHWHDAATQYAHLDLQVGQAAVALRLTLTSPVGPSARDFNDSVLRAETAGAPALGWLARVHRHIAQVLSGEQPATDALGPLQVWAASTGSASYGRGLIRLLTCAATAAGAGGDIVGGRRLLADAEQLALALAAPLELQAVSSSLTDLFGGSYRLLSAALGLADARALLPGAGGGASLWLQALTEAARVGRAAPAIGDPEFSAQTAALLRDLIGRAPKGPDNAIIGPGLDLAATISAEQDVLSQLLRASTLAEQGWPDEARVSATAALSAANTSASPYLACLALMLLDRKDEARSLATDIHPRLDPDIASYLLLRVGDPEGALASWQQHVPPASDDQPWGDLGHQAAMYVALQRWAEGADFADRAVASFEQRSARLGRDVLRTQAGDDGAVAAAYTAAVTAHAALAEHSGVGPDETATERDLAFQFADQARAGLLTLADAVAAAARGHPDVRPALRSWLTAGSAWAADVEAAARDLLKNAGAADPAAVRVRVDSSEMTLTQAERHLASAAPQVLAARRSPGAAPCRGQSRAASDIRAAIPPDAVLLEYHTDGDVLVVFAVTKSTLTVHRRTVSALDLAARVRTLHRTYSTQGGHPDGAVLTWLSEVLLEPARRELVPRQATFALLIVLALLTILRSRGWVAACLFRQAM